MIWCTLFKLAMLFSKRGSKPSTAVTSSLDKNDRASHHQYNHHQGSTSSSPSPLPTEKGGIHDPEYDAVHADFSHINSKKVLRKMDIRLIPMLSLLYLLAFLDRGNIGNAKIEGMVEDLNMTGPQYNWTLSRLLSRHLTLMSPKN